MLIWDGSPEELDRWIKEVFSNKRRTKAEVVIDNIEG